MKPTTSDEEEIFCQAVNLSDAAGREEFLRQACGPDVRLRQNIDALLADHEQATRMFQEVAAGFSLDKESLPDIADDSGADSEIGTSIGPYRLVQRLGEGGGGIVYEAEQETPVHRKVALKILKPGVDQMRVMNRFQVERQALELMEHPNIARVLDAGATSDGRPYFVMELVRGAKITVHCAQHAVPLAARLQLLQQVCSAVQHAHQKGIIHCDLKPSNILVTLVEGTPVPKVIDFGIAKATAGVPAEWPLQGCPVGTPAYMSPEQINGSTDIDTRSDIYSLGAVMYELLAGRAPFDQEESSKTVLHDIRHRLANEQPLRPSQVGRQNGAANAKINEDLDWIVMTALDKDRERRYATMRGLSEDIAHYLADEPIRARPPSRIYRFRKFVRRNRFASGALAAGILTLVVGFTTSTLLYLRAAAAEQQQVQLRAMAEAAEQKQAQLRAEAEEREHVAKAAILLMQNKIAEADAEIQLMGGMLTQPSIEATNVFHKLATWNALRGEWKAASQRLLALSRVNRFDENDLTDNVTRDLIPIAPTLAEIGDYDTLRQFEAWLTQTLGQTNNPIAAEEVLKICLLLPPSDGLRKQLDHVAQVAERSLPAADATRINWLRAWRCFAVGLWQYRNSQDVEAVRLLNQAMNASGKETAIYACCLAVRSMAFQKLGQAVNAQADFDEADALVKGKFSSTLEIDNQGLWHDWLTARILLREAANK